MVAPFAAGATSCFGPLLRVSGRFDEALGELLEGVVGYRSRVTLATRTKLFDPLFWTALNALSPYSGDSSGNHVIKPAGDPLLR